MTSPENGQRSELLGLQTPPIVSAEEWKAAWEQLHMKEKAHSRARDALAAERRRMPWLAVEKEYAFIGPEGKVGLLDLFDGRRQLILYRAFFEPGVSRWPERACIGCSMVADQVAHPAHLNARDTSLAFVSRAPQPDINRMKARIHSRRQTRVPHLLHRRPWRRANGKHLELPRPHCTRSPGIVGGLT